MTAEEQNLTEENKAEEEKEKTQIQQKEKDSTSKDFIWKKLWEIFLDEFLNHDALKKVKIRISKKL